MNLQKAKELAVAICYKLQPFCDKINIAGSIRRGKPEVKDIEIVCLPKTVDYEESDLFGTVTTTKILVSGFVTIVNSLGKVIKGKADGRMMQIELSEGINLDLFMPVDYDYYRQYAIRTGSSDYSNMVIAYGWKKIGWCGTENGLRKQNQCDEKKLPDGKTKWICKHPNPELPPVWQSEEEFFKWLGVPYKQPKDRIM